MKIHSLKMHGFMLYKSFYKVFDDKEIVGIVCEYKNNSNRSNKGGKSTTIDAIKYALYGTSRAEREVELIHHGMDHMYVELVLSDGKKQTRIKRGRDIKNIGVLEISGVEKKTEAQSVLDELIGYNKDEFELTCFFNQMDINQFMDLKPAQKKQYLMTWLKNTHWSLWEKLVNEDVKEILESISRKQAVIESVESDISDLKTLKKELSECQSSIEDYKTKVSKLEKSFYSAKGGVEKCEKLETEIEDLIDEMDAIKDSREEYLELKEELKGIKKYSGVKLEPLKKEQHRLIADIAKLISSKQHVKERIKEVGKTGGVCPLLGEKCDRVGSNVKIIKEWKKKEEKLSEEKSVLNAELKKIRSKVSSVERFEKISSEIESLEKDVKRESDIKKRIKEKKLEKEKVGSSDEGEVKQKLKKAKLKLSELMEDAGGLKEQISEIKENKSKVQKLKSEVKIHQLHLQNLKYVSYMFGKNGIPSQEIENAFDEIEDEINFVLERLGTNMTVLFRPDRETQQYESMCVQCGWKFPSGVRVKTCKDCGAERLKKRKDELQLRVIDGVNDSGFYMESGGGKTLVSLAVRIALTRLKQRQTGSDFNVVFLDEPDAALDKENKHAFVQLITKTLIKEFGFQQVFWVSHDREIQGSIPDVLKVIRYSTYSKARWV